MNYQILFTIHSDYFKLQEDLFVKIKPNDQNTTDILNNIGDLAKGELDWEIVESLSSSLDKLTNSSKKQEDKQSKFLFIIDDQSECAKNLCNGRGECSS